jgi:RNA polymerase-binding protein DksA
MSPLSLNRAQQDEIEARLRERARALREEIRAQLSGSDDPMVVGLRDRLADTGDWAVADALSELDVAIVSRDLAELANVQSAQRRLAEGVYGTCADCGEDIPYARLAANPAATRCVACQERRERRPGGT